MTVLGIDPGQSGALAMLDRSGRLMAVEDMPVVDGWVSPVLLSHAIFRMTEEYGVLDLVVIEKVRSMPRQGVASSFKFGAAWGIVVGLCATWPTEQPSPSVWKRHMGLTSDKDTARAMALELWPGSASLFARKKDADRAEAALLAEWGRRLLVERAA